MLTTCPSDRVSVVQKVARPLELKTGRPSRSAEHLGQVAMYSMMLAQMAGAGAGAGDAPMLDGLLMYLIEGKPTKIKSNEQTQKGKQLL